jgi:hypothetical protein
MWPITKDVYMQVTPAVKMNYFTVCVLLCRLSVKTTMLPASKILKYPLFLCPSHLGCPPPHYRAKRKIHVIVTNFNKLLQEVFACSIRILGHVGVILLQGVQQSWARDAIIVTHFIASISCQP